ncbi:aluminum-activated malate transporter 9-like isoform X2 [Musa acuminata AAA Group]|uniref:aluminum-activated malate transporter 9-like isoform X2 n=1 Tax=Musa acuminata AAA Group TaxID=214697 RepID=UPI0031D9BFBA
MNGSRSSNKVDVSLSPNAVLPEFVKKSSKESSLLTKCIRDVLEFAEEDTNRVTFALKVRTPHRSRSCKHLPFIAVRFLSRMIRLGATLYRGFNRAVGSLFAGIFAILVIGISMSSGRFVEPFVVGFSIFLVGAATSFVKLWPSCVPYEYGFRVILFTYCLIVVSTYRMSNPMRTAMERLYSIAIGAAVTVGVNLLVFPIWAGEQLHEELVNSFYCVAESLEECARKYLSGDGLEHTEFCKRVVIDEFPDDPACQRCRAILNSSARIESLANSAKWEPPHGRFRHYYGAWSEYVKVGAVLRHCAYEVMALYGCLRSEIQAPIELRVTFQTEILEATVEAAELLRGLANDLGNMKHTVRVSQLMRVRVSTDRLQRSVDLHSYLLNSHGFPHKPTGKDCSHGSGSDPSSKLHREAERSPATAQPQTRTYHETMKKQQRRLYSWPSREVDELEEEDGGGDSAELITRMRALESTAALSLATFALLLIEFVARLDHLVDAVEQLAATAKFKQQAGLERTK